MLAGISEVLPRVQAVRDRLDRLGLDAFVASLDKLARDAASGTAASDVDAMLACALWLDEKGRPRVAELLNAARRGDHRVAIAMLENDDNEDDDTDSVAPPIRKPAHKQLARHGRLLDHGGPNRVLRLATIWHPPASAYRHHIEWWMEELGDKISPALRLHYERLEGVADPEDDIGRWEHMPLPRHHIAMQLERLTMRPDREVIRMLLRDRSVRLKEVIKVAARRPTTSAIVEELVAHGGWMSRLAVRIAMIENPFTPTRTALLLLPTCRTRLRAIATAKVNVHPRLHSLATTLLAA